MNNIKTKMMVILPLCLSLLTGCAAMHTSMSKQDLVVQTRMTRTVFLEPVASNKRTVFIETRNTSGVRFIGITNTLRASLEDKGYTIVQDPDKAHFMVQANFLKLGKVTAREIDGAYNAGFGGALLGSSIAAVAGGDGRAVVGAGLAGAAIGVAMDAMTKDVYYILVADVKVSERLNGVMEFQRTRVISTANKVNLTFGEAVPELAAEITEAIAGIF